MRLPWLWPFVLVVPSMFRFAQTRPHLLSTALTGLPFSAMVHGGAWPVFHVSAALSWLHLALFRLGLMTVIAVLAVRWPVESVLEWRKLVAGVAGLAAGFEIAETPTGPRGLGDKLRRPSRTRARARSNRR